MLEFKKVTFLTVLILVYKGRLTAVLQCYSPFLGVGVDTKAIKIQIPKQLLREYPAKSRIICTN